jgi:hypothetical protein
MSLIECQYGMDAAGHAGEETTFSFEIDDKGGQMYNLYNVA